MHQCAFLTRGLANVRAELSLTALAYNLRRALNILGVEAMTAAAASRDVGDLLCRRQAAFRRSWPGALVVEKFRPPLALFGR
jgi:hypothetical protein